jgi:hypothetical protein
LFAHAIHHGAHALKIWIPAAAAGVVRVTDHVPERRPLAAYLASHSHDNSSPIFTKSHKESSLAEISPIRIRFDSFHRGEVHYGVRGFEPHKIRAPRDPQQSNFLAGHTPGPVFPHGEIGEIIFGWAAE